MRRVAVIAFGVAIAVLVAKNWELVGFFLIVSINELLGVPCGGLC